MKRLVLSFVACAGAGLALLVLLAVIALRPPAPPRERYAELAAGRAVLEDLARDRVTFLRIQDWCQAYSAPGEQRANTLRSTCLLDDDSAFTGRATPYALFDDAARHRYRGLAERLRRFPYGVHYVTIEYAPDGSVARAEVAIDVRWHYESLHYEPGWSDRPPPARPHTGLDGDWYHTQENWR